MIKKKFGRLSDRGERNFFLFVLVIDWRSWIIDEPIFSMLYFYGYKENMTSAIKL